MRISDWSSDVCSSDLIAKAASFLKIGEGQFLKLIEGKLEAKDVTIDDVTALPWANTDVTSVPLLRTTLGPHGRWLLHVSRTEGAMVRPDFIRFSMTDRKSTRLNSSP